VRRREEAAGEVVRPGVVRALDPSGEMPFGLLAQPCTAMAADVEQRVDRPLLVSRDDDAVVADRAREKVAGAWNLVGAPRADPAVEIETLQLGAIEVGVGVKLSGKGRVHRVARLKARAPSASRQASMIQLDAHDDAAACARTLGSDGNRRESGDRRLDLPASVPGRPPP